MRALPVARTPARGLGWSLASARIETLKNTFSLVASCAFAVSVLLGSGGCGAGDSPEPAAQAAPQNEIDLLLNDYEKSAMQFAKTARKMKAGDVSLTLRYIDQRKELQAWQPKLQAAQAKMSPAQAQRAAAITAKVAPDLQT